MIKCLRRRGFTFIEVMMVILIISILAYVGAWVAVLTVKNSVFIPNQLSMDQLVDDAINLMTDGDHQAWGLRFCLNVTNVTATRVDFRSANNTAVYYRWDNTTNKLYRSVGGATEQLIPRYMPATGVNVSGKNGAVFTYYDANEVVTNAAVHVRRVSIVLSAKSGTGLYDDWQGQSEQVTSVAVERMQ